MKTQPLFIQCLSFISLIAIILEILSNRNIFNLQEGIKITQWLTHHSFATKPSTVPPKVQASQSLFQIISLM